MSSPVHLAGESILLRKLRTNGEKYAQVLQSKNILATHEHSVFVWHAEETVILTTTMSQQEDDTADKEPCLQTLRLTTPPLFEVDKLTFNHIGSLLALTGQNGVMVVELPWRWGKLGSLEGNQEQVLCRSWSIAEHFFICSSHIVVVEVAWHPGSENDVHLTVLSSDNYLRIYEVKSDYNLPQQVIALNPKVKSFLCASGALTSFPGCLGETAISFDFGPPIAKSGKQSSEIGMEEKDLIWPIFILKGNGDVYVTKSSLKKSRTQPQKVQGPLAMYPPAEDNYGVDACSLLCLSSSPPVIVIATSSGMLYHCLVLDSNTNSGEENESEISWHPANSSEVEICADIDLYVYESVELSLSLTSESTDTDSCYRPIQLHKDISLYSRYHCMHTAGIHTVMLPIIQQLEEYAEISDSKIWMSQIQGKKSIVEHLLCTQPLTSIDPVPVLGLGIAVGHFGSMLVCLVASWEFICIPLAPIYQSTPLALLSTDEESSTTSPLQPLREDVFNHHIQHLLKCSTSTPLLRTHLTNNTEPSPQQWLELLCSVTQRLREEYMQRLDAVHAQIERRVKVLQQQKKQQEQDLEKCLKDKEVLRDGAEKLAEKYEDIRDHQQKIVSRIEQVLLHLQRCLPILSDAEFDMQKELKSLEDKVKNFNNSVQQIRIKQEYQNKKMIEYQTSSQIVSEGNLNLIAGHIGELQCKHIKEILAKEGTSIAELIQAVKWLKKETCF